MPTATSSNSNSSGRWSKLFSKKQAPSEEQQRSAKEIAELDDAQVKDADAAETSGSDQNQENQKSKEKEKKKITGETLPSSPKVLATQGGEEVRGTELDPARQSKDQDEEDEEEEIYSGRILFFNKGEPWYFLSNGSDYPVYYENVRYPTAEHLFQCLKFLPHAPEVANKVRKAPTSLDAVKIARSNAISVKKGWIKDGINVVEMRNVVLTKFSQYGELRKSLLATSGDIINASPTDVFWGGLKMGSRNELGKALMATRETLRRHAGLGIGSGALTV